MALSVYWHHFKMMGGMKMLLTMTFFVVITQLAIIASDYWLAYWTNDELPLADGPQNKSDGFYLGCYAGLIGVAGIALLGRGVVFAYGGYSASRNHHRAVVKGVLEAPSTFFDRTSALRAVFRPPPLGLALCSYRSSRCVNAQALLLGTPTNVCL